MPRHGHQYVPPHVSDLTPWDVSRHVPQDGSRASLEDVRFLLWTSNNAGNDEYQTLKEGDLTTLGHFNGNDPTVVVVHGFGDHGDKGWAVTAKTELLKLGSYNVICVEWGRLAVSPWYPSAVNNVPKVGNLTAHLLDWLHEAAGMQAAEVQVVGHSLGAHVAGAIGQNLKNFRLPFITGLDPAAPEFTESPESSRLDKTDADFVQVIHTNAGGILDGCVGLTYNIGHVDFFPNGGEHQPGCTIGGSWIDLLTGGCSHAKSHKYWIESINGMPAFVSRPCSDWEHLHDGRLQCLWSGLPRHGLPRGPKIAGHLLSRNQHVPTLRYGRRLSCTVSLTMDLEGEVFE
ncbi:pancreatic lipase-related protein 2-like [Portunus trituberculatus]|uniref:pancreatic lipase-related protein 2-like n=1 Tax=Portunus trituberculatus TaxID=210409 RepID=UPI001E1CFF46|nr:pancreatic lipase-related protein 2-like [Portunus trituberculatus]